MGKGDTYRSVNKKKHSERECVACKGLGYFWNENPFQAAFPAARGFKTVCSLCNGMGRVK